MWNGINKIFMEFNRKGAFIWVKKLNLKIMV